MLSLSMEGAWEYSLAVFIEESRERNYRDRREGERNNINGNMKGEIWGIDSINITFP